MNTLPLWRRCRVLANHLRLNMLKQLSRKTDCCVKSIAETLEITEDVASKNLQLLAAAGFITRRQVGKYLYYSLIQNDTLLIEVMKLVHSNKQDRVVSAATALTYERRIRLIYILGSGPLQFEALCRTTGFSRIALERQLEKLVRRGFIGSVNERYLLTVPDSALGKKMVELAMAEFTLAQV